MKMNSLFYILFTLCLALTPPIDCQNSNNNLLAKSEETLYQEGMGYGDDDDIIEFQFDDMDLDQLVDYIEKEFDVSFITPDALDPLPENTRSLKGHKLSFQTNKSFSKKEAWNLFLTFLNIAGFAVIPGDGPRQFRVVAVEAVEKYPLKTFIGTPLSAIPDNDEIIRYVYFIKNSNISALQPIVDAIKSSQAEVVALQDHKAFLIIDKAHNVRPLIGIISELDKVSMPQAMSIVKLHRADADEVKELLDTLIKDDSAGPGRLFPPRKKSTSLYFPEGVKIIAEERTNSLILLGPQDALDKIEGFIKRVDGDLNKPYSPLYVYDLRYAEAQAIAAILQEVTAFEKESTVGQFGGVRGGDKFLKNMTFTAEPSTNRLIIRGSYEDYLKVKEIIEQLDEPQPQVAIEVLILALSTKETKQLGAQIRTKKPSSLSKLLGDQVTFQTSGLNTGPLGGSRGIVENQNDGGILRLLGDLISLASGAEAGNTLISLGDSFGVWAIFQALDNIVSSDVVANPFLVATNKTRARVSIGETRRVVTGTVVGAGGSEDAFGSDTAALTLEIIPQINSDGMIVLDISILIEAFIGLSDPFNVAKNTRSISTKTVVADKEVLALGGLVQNRVENGQSNGFPVLSKIPIFGWLFKNQSQVAEKDNLLVLISTEIIDPTESAGTNSFTEEHIADYYNMSSIINKEFSGQDPDNKLCFGDRNNRSDTIMDEFLAHREHKIKADREKKRKKKNGRRKKKNSNKRKAQAPSQEAVDRTNFINKSTDRLLAKGRP